MRISDWSSDVCSSDLGVPQERRRVFFIATRTDAPILFPEQTHGPGLLPFVTVWDAISDLPKLENGDRAGPRPYGKRPQNSYQALLRGDCTIVQNHSASKLSRHNQERMRHIPARSEEHTSELQSLMRISYAVFCLTKKNQKSK